MSRSPYEREWELLELLAGIFMVIILGSCAVFMTKLVISLKP